MLVDRRTGRRLSELAGPSESWRQRKPPAPCRKEAPGAAWRWHDWAWDSRRMQWVAEYHHVSHPLRAREQDDGSVAGTTNGRHWKTAADPAALLDLFFPIGGRRRAVH